MRRKSRFVMEFNYKRRVWHIFENNFILIVNLIVKKFSTSVKIYDTRYCRHRIEIGEEEKIEDEFDVFHRRRKFDRSSQTVYFFPRFKYVSELDIPFFLQLHVYSISFVSVFRRTRKRRKWGRNIQFGLMPQSVTPAAVFTQNKETHPSTSIFPRSCHRRSPFSKGGTLYPT